MEAEAVLICMAFPILRKYFWQEERGRRKEKECGDFPTSKEYEAMQEALYCHQSKTP